MIILYLLMGVFRVYQEGKQSQERDCVAKIGHKVRYLFYICTRFEI